jgi:hypothetical protein
MEYIPKKVFLQFDLPANGKGSSANGETAAAAAIPKMAFLW